MGISLTLAGEPICGVLGLILLEIMDFRDDMKARKEQQ